MPAEGQTRKPRPAPARVFFALWPPEDIALKLAAVADAHAATAGGRATRSATIHLTLAFIGDVAVDRLPDLQNAAATVRAEAFDLTLDHLGIWRHNQILWAGCAIPPGLATLVAALRSALRAGGFAPADAGRTFRPHVTLVRKLTTPDLPLPAFAPLLWPCTRFVLVRSGLSANGSSYGTLAEFPLGLDD